MPTKEYRPYSPHQLLILPPSLQEWLPEGHLAYFISDLVESFDLSAIETTYEDELRGGPPYHPAMMVKVLLYAYCTGVYSSRRVARRLHEDVAFRVLAAGNAPDFRTISEFRRRHLTALGGLFQQVLRLAQRAGLVKLGHVALDGTKIRANASKHKAMSYGRMQTEEARLAAEVTAMLQRAEETDAAEDARYGPEGSGEEVPEELRRREHRLRRIREAKAALEAEAKQRADAERAKRADQAVPEPPRGRPPKPPRETPRDRDQYNFTDPESRIMKNADGAFIQAYNAQVAVDRKHQIIVAADVMAQAADAPHLVPMVETIVQNTGEDPDRLIADAGYFSEANVTALTGREIEAFITPDKTKHTQPTPPAPRGRIPTQLSLQERMRRKLRTKAGRAIYNLRKAIVEPVIGQIKSARGFRRFLLRGRAKVKGEWLLVTTAHNLCKLFGARPRVYAALRW
ncbi:MAG: IS1182 family transposase [Armatimonadota bacterium]|nr:IS1182 family transposase [Armatimonadota bacterium]